MTTTTQFHPINVSALLLAREASPVRRAHAFPARRVDAPALWRQSLRVNESRSLVERAVTVLLVLLTAAAIGYGVLTAARTFHGNHFPRAVARIAGPAAR